VGVDHAYIQWYPQALAGGRKGWIGYGGPGSTLMAITNEGGELALLPSGGVGIGTGSPSCKLEVVGDIRAAGEIQTTSANAFRMVHGNFGAFWRNDGADTYFLLTDPGTPYANWNGLRPLYINNTTGDVGMSNVNVSGNLRVGGNLNWVGDHTGQNYVAIGGLKICWGSFELTMTKPNWEYFNYISFPQAFTATPVITASVSDPGWGRNVADTVAGVIVENVAQCRVFVKRIPLVGSNPLDATVTVNWIAIGH
jgi:hypothetical protein